MTGYELLLAHILFYILRTMQAGHMVALIQRTHPVEHLLIEDVVGPKQLIKTVSAKLPKVTLEKLIFL